MAAVGLVWCCATLSLYSQENANARKAIRRGSEYLLGELRAWDRDHQCVTCHNHGQGLRALFVAGQKGLGPAVADLSAVHETWLVQPQRWQLQEATPGGDQKLADLHYALALLAGARAGAVRLPTQLRWEVAERLSKHAGADGGWPRDPTSELGTPLTFGTSLGTVLLRDTLTRMSPVEHRETIQRADAWLARQQPANVVEAASLVLGLIGDASAEADKQREACRRLLAAGQGPDGGWGPYRQSPPEPFDTALAVLALAAAPATWEPERSERLRRGVEFLVREQLESGGWRETTRPAGRDSYAQHIATTAWAVEALVTAVERDR